jgi:RND family efflux transporter MFP subunit
MLPRWVTWSAAGVLLTGFLLWGGRHAYCHFYGDMTVSPSGVRAAAPQPLPVVTVIEPLRRPAVHSITLPATVEAFEKAKLYAKVTGYLGWIKVDKGDRVRKGQVLAQIQVPEMEKEYQRALAEVQEAEAADERAQAHAKLKELTYSRLAGIRESQPDVIPQQEVDEARAGFDVARGDVKLAKAKVDFARAEVERLETLMEYAKIRSPYNGVVTARFVDSGVLIQSAAGSGSNASALVTVMDIHKVRVYVNVPEPDVVHVDVGDPVDVVLDALPGKTFRGAVTRSAMALDPGTRTMKVEIDLPNPGHSIRPGMFGEATLKLGEESGALFLRSESVRQDSDGEKYVFTVGDGRIRKKTVETGLDDGKLLQVKGLQGDETVVLNSTEELRDGLPVKAVKAGS